MTGKLTPAEALAMFKDWQSPDVTIHGFIEKWYVPASPDSFADIAITALEEALSLQQKQAAPHAMEPSCAKCGHPKSNHPFRHPFQPVMLSLGASPTAAPVPSDGEIVAGLSMIDLPSNTPWAAISHLTKVVSLLARRIGVKFP